MSESSGLSIPLSELISCLDDTIDLVSPQLADHHKKVGSIASTLGRHLGLPEEECVELLFAGNLHDIGALSLAERIRLMDFEVDETLHHSETGALLLEMFTPLAKIANLVRYHHVQWKEGRGTLSQGKQVPMGGHVLHLADRIAVLVGGMERIQLLGKVRDIRDRIERESGAMFPPHLVDAFLALSRRESFWLELAFPLRNPAIERRGRFKALQLDTEGIVGLSRLFARIIDFRSHFTATHSSGVAASAEALARLAGRPGTECVQMKIAGLLHDLGKLAVPSELLEKPASLTPRERKIIRCHTFFTRRALEKISAFESIAAWSSNHHERIDGNGYPFHVEGRYLSLGSRIVAVSDVFTAITEDRPYRAGMDKPRAQETITAMVAKRALDPDVTEMLMNNYEEVNAIRMTAQAEAAQEYGQICARVAPLATSGRHLSPS